MNSREICSGYARPFWHLMGDVRLGANARRVLDDDNSQLVVPIIVLAEAKHIADRRRVPMLFDDLWRCVANMPNCIVFPLDVFTLAYFPAQLDIHDSLIVATALYCREFFSDEVSVLTTDLASTQSGFVPVLW